MFRKNKLAMIVGEFLGTAALTLTVLALTHSQIGSLGFFTPVSAGLMVALMTLALAGISGAVFNPAMTIGLWTVRKLRTLQAIAYLLVQLAGAYVAFELFVYLTKITGVHNSGVYSSRVLVAEVVGTVIFSFGWAAAIYQRFSLFAKAATIGASLTAGSLVASIASAGLLNPAVALGLRQWGWLTYVAGPVLGAVIGFNLYNLLFVETELAEVAASKDEKERTSKLNATLTTSTVEAANDTEDVEEEAEADSKTTKRASGRATAAARPRSTTPAKKTPAKRKTNTTTRRRNPNAA
ncbi:MAG TPA: aquaporin [Verrucomicrobiae bacterium]|nr:aquaporin [Verrucomicrobiae bacterium]